MSEQALALVRPWTWGRSVEEEEEAGDSEACEEEAGDSEEWTVGRMEERWQ